MFMPVAILIKMQNLLCSLTVTFQQPAYLKSIEAKVGGEPELVGRSLRSQVAKESEYRVGFAISGILPGNKLLPQYADCLCGRDWFGMQSSSPLPGIDKE